MPAKKKVAKKAPKKKVAKKRTLARRPAKQKVEDRTKVEAAHVTMAEAGFNPLEWAIKIAQGKALTEDHPFLKILTKWVDMWIKNITEKGLMLTADDLEEFQAEAALALTDSHTPIKIRADQIKDLLQYVYPKLKAVDHSGQIQHDIKLTPLSKEELAAFKEVFDEKY